MEKKKRPFTEAHRAANKKWDKENLARFGVALPVPLKEKMAAAAADLNESQNQFVKTSIEERLERLQS